MPEGPTIVIAREELACFSGKKILRAEGNAKFDMSRLVGQRVIAIRSWGKHLLIELPEVAVRVHFLMFGSYTVDARKDRAPRLQLGFKRGEVSFYGCAIKLVEGGLDAAYDWGGDVMSDAWDADAALRKLRRMPEVVICDALLDQDVFAGVGNIIKNEVLHRVRVHPLSAVGDIPVVKLREIIAQARQYSFEFLAWRRASVLRQNLLVHGKGSCPSCGRKLSRAWLGKRKRRSFFCEHCQLRHGPAQGSAGARRTTKTRGKARAKAKAKPEAKSNSKGKAKAKAKAKTKTTARFGRNTS